MGILKKNPRIFLGFFRDLSTAIYNTDKNRIFLFLFITYFFLGAAFFAGAATFFAGAFLTAIIKKLWNKKNIYIHFIVINYFYLDFCFTAFIPYFKVLLTVINII